jgi:sterol desaturase/sphingolipid hydroxylase (fatty acid hydroxylase superfamily)
MTTESVAQIVSNVFFGMALIALLCLLAAEKFRPYRKYTATIAKESVLTNTTAFLFNNVILTLLRASSLFLVAQNFAGNGLLHSFEEGPLKWVITFLLYDLAIYLWHLINHHNDFLWRFHKVHHSDKVFNVTTGFRFHFIDLLLEIPYKCAFVILIGVNAYIILAIETIQLVFILFHHSNLKIPNEDKLSKFIITPSLHRTHHSALRSEHDSNYGIVLAFWDRLFGTRKELEPERIGLDIIIADNFVQLFCLAFVTERQFLKILRMIPRSGK